MVQLLKTAWYLISFSLIIIIMIQNPKAEGAGVKIA
nr:preprotein translocase subunit G [Madagascaria erythrocladioides]QUE28972.1 SecG [Madagascaria erythrocladioides]UNJ16523.1 preprotein translocase subunit G [Madagascaria erythrocladioides]